MRKIICFLLVAIVCFAAVGCSVSEKDESTYTSATPQQVLPTETPIQYPPHIESVWEELSSAIEENDIDIKIDDHVTYNGDDESGFFEISFDGATHTSDTHHDISFFYNDGKAKESFSAGFKLPGDSTLMRNFIQAAFLFSDGTLTKDEALSKTQELSNSYQLDDYSSIAHSGDYAIFIAPKESFGYSNLELVYLPEVKKETDYSTYEEQTYETALAGDINSGLSICFDGVVVDVYTEEPDRGYRNVIFEDENSNKYNVEFLVSSNPINFVVGEQYSVYGMIMSNDGGSLPVIYLLDAIKIK